MKNLKVQLLNSASMALIYSSNFKSSSDLYQTPILVCADKVREFEPEFILKVALYSRQEMNIRSASNFLLSYAAYHNETRPYLGKYFESCIRLPSDWIEVAELYQLFADKRLKCGSLPAVLKRVMRKSFGKFDIYQLGKYNRQKSKKKTIMTANASELQTTDETPNCASFTLKQLIRLLHLKSPVNEIMCLLGKKYPETAECFKKSGLKGVWDSKRAGERMKLPQPETWETQISIFGNEPSMWEALIDNSKLPYMAMLCNLRNLILSGISMKYHSKILKHLENKNAVMHSRQLPLKFFEAYKVLTSIEDLLNNKVATFPEENAVVPVWKQKRLKKTSNRMENASNVLLKNYKDAVSRALEISALHNLQPIPGKSFIICDVLPFEKINIKAKSKAYQMCIMMGLMCLKACENSKMEIICGDSSDTVLLDNNDSFLEKMLETCSKHQDVIQNCQPYSSAKALKKVTDFYLRQQVLLRERLDHIIYLRCSEAVFGSEIRNVMTSFLKKYRQIVNPELLYTDVDLSNKTNSFIDDLDCRDIYLSGNIAQLIKFIAERSTFGQLEYVDNIDTKYNLSTEYDFSQFNKQEVETTATAPINICSRVPKWHTVRIFISSTFKDMHSERDMLIRYVFPELKKRAASVFVKIIEVDLRWGITETDCASMRAAELCLLEAQNSDIFIGILGERYGTLYTFEPPNSPDLQWIKEYPKGLSITELEMHAGALRNGTKKKALFYIRDNSFLSLVPEKWKSYFASENPESMTKLEALKTKVKSSGQKLFNGYPCHFAGELKNKPVTAGLDVFGKAVLNDLWELITEMHQKDPYVDDVAEEENFQQHLLDSIDFFTETKTSPLIPFMKKIKNQAGIFLVSGSPGSGKTAFIINALRKSENISFVKFFVGLTPRSTDLRYMLRFICSSFARTYPMSFVLPKLKSDIENQFADILQAAVTSFQTSPFALVLDGLDHLSLEDQMLDWLPLKLPPGLRLICSASDTSYAFKVLCGRQEHGNSVHLEHLSAITQYDRESIVQSYLKLYGKTLDESPFNNQLLQLVTKKDAGIPLYLRISCDFLRTYASFENFTAMIQSLPSTIPLLLQEIMIQMENEYSSILIQTMFTLLCITKEGLDDTDLHFLLSLAQLEKGKSGNQSLNKIISQIIQLKPENFISKVTYCSLMHLISNFAYGNNRLRRHNLMGSEFAKIVKTFYLNKNYLNFSNQMHLYLAAYYQTLCDPGNNSMWRGRSSSAYRSLIYHLFHGQYYDTLGDYLCCLTFLEAMFSVDAADYLLEYYLELLVEIKNGSSEAARNMDFSLISSYSSFVSRNLHIFQVYPHLITQQALNEPPESFVRFHMNNYVIQSCMVENLSPKVFEPRIATIAGFVQKVSAISYQYGEPIALLGCEDGYLKVLHLNSKKIMRNIKSHSSKITYICVIGKQRIVTASSDTTLSIWNSVDFNRIFLLKGHQQRVSCCCTDSSTSILFSSGWDNSVRLWSLYDGKSISVIDDFGCPVNCLDHHPMKQQFACGLWNGSIEIWDAVALKSLLVLTNNRSSVKSIAYTPDGISIISSYLNADIIIWSSEQGMKISRLRGHSLSVGCISYSNAEDMIVSGSEDCTLKLWPTKTGLFLHNLPACKFCPISLMKIISSNFLAVCYQNSDMWVIDISSGLVVCKIKLESDMVSCLSRISLADITDTDGDSNTDGASETWTNNALVFGCQSGNISVLNYMSSSIMPVGSIDARVTYVTHNKKAIISANCEGDIGVFFYPDMNSKVIYGAHKGYVSNLSLNTISGSFVSSASDKVMKSWMIHYEEKDVSLNHVYSSQHKDFITSCCWFLSDDSEIEVFITGSHDNNVILQEGNSKTIFHGLKTTVVCVDFTENKILGCGSDGSVAIWSHDGKLLSYIAGIDQSSAVLSFHIEKNIINEFDITLAFADKDGSVKIQKPIERPYCHSLEGHTKGIISCCANQNGEIMSCSLDGTINLWKLPLELQGTTLHHLGSVTDILQSNSDHIVLSSDVCGSIVLWEFSHLPTFSLIYGTKKTYTAGYITAMSWLQDKNFICAVTQTIDHKEIYFLDTLCYDCITAEDHTQYNLRVKNTDYFDSEVLSIHANSTSEIIVATLKSGDFTVIAHGFKRNFQTCEDWILKANIFGVGDDSTSQYLYIALVNGLVKRVELSQVLKFSKYARLNFEELYSPASQDVFFTSFLSCESEEKLFYGDAKGWLRVFSGNEMCFENKVHDDALTGILVKGNYVFTSSLDRTLKGWNLSTLDQVCQYHCAVPITCIVSCEIISEEISTVSHFLSIGTTSGTIQLLKVYTKK